MGLKKIKDEEVNYKETFARIYDLWHNISNELGELTKQNPGNKMYREAWYLSADWHDQLVKMSKKYNQ